MGIGREEELELTVFQLEPPAVLLDEPVGKVDAGVADEGLVAPMCHDRRFAV